MKKIYGLTLTLSLLLGGEYGIASEPSFLPPKTSSETQVVHHEWALSDWLPDGNKTPFLGKVKWPSSMTFQPISLAGIPAKDSYTGLVTVHDKKIRAPIMAVGVEMKGAHADDLFQGMFLPGGYTEEAGKAMLSFNMALMQSENMMNDLFLKTMTSTVKVTGQAIPFDLMAVDVLSVEQLHKMKSVKDTYTFAIRPLFVADGWMIPLYVRGIAAKREGAYRFVLLGGLDNSKAEVNQAAWEVSR